MSRIANSFRIAVAAGLIGGFTLATILNHNPNPTELYQGYVTAPYQVSIESFPFKPTNGLGVLVQLPDDYDNSKLIRYINEAYKNNSKIAFKAKKGPRGMLELKDCIHPTLDGRLD